MSQTQISAPQQIERLPLLVKLSKFGLTGGAVIGDAVAVLFDVPKFRKPIHPLSDGAQQLNLKKGWPDLDSFDDFRESLAASVTQAFLRRGGDEKKIMEEFDRRFEKEIAPAQVIVVGVSYPFSQKAWFMFRCKEGTNGVMFYAIALAYALAYRMEEGKTVFGYVRKEVTCVGRDGRLACSSYTPGLFGIRRGVGLNDLTFNVNARSALFEENIIVVYPTVQPH